jgi:hypothetical protein
MQVVEDTQGQLVVVPTNLRERVFGIDETKAKEFLAWTVQSRQNASEQDAGGVEGNRGKIYPGTDAAAALCDTD